MPSKIQHDQVTAPNQSAVIQEKMISSVTMKSDIVKNDILVHLYEYILEYYTDIFQKNSYTRLFDKW